ncbi:MAG: hypothetical protein ACOH2M_29115 [Cypionkella sp.]
MPFRTRNIARETVAAVAVIAIYILVLLAPLHQAAGLQRDLAKLGYATLDNWSVCAPLAPKDAGDKPPAVVKCAASGIGKNDLAASAPVAIDLNILRLADIVSYARVYPTITAGPNLTSGQPGGPPAA